MAYPNEGNEEPMSAAEASSLVRSMIHLEASGPGDYERAMERLSNKYSFSFWTLDHLRKRKAKTCDVGLFSRIRSAYLDVCGRQIAKLQTEIAVEKAITADDTLEDLEAEASALAARIAARKAQRGMR